ncbi:MAG: hypothetical protein U0995_10425 [Erythrobacter sp.]|nr:hypothetical protein [Erythrobacter sp.]MDZ4276444.1 hypothetical protein [Erythrobacter sp.]
MKPPTAALLPIVLLLVVKLRLVLLLIAPLLVVLPLVAPLQPSNR